MEKRQLIITTYDLPTIHSSIIKDFTRMTGHFLEDKPFATPDYNKLLSEVAVMIYSTFHKENPYEDGKIGQFRDRPSDEREKKEEEDDDDGNYGLVECADDGATKNEQKNDRNEDQREDEEEGGVGISTFCLLSLEGKQGRYSSSKYSSSLINTTIVTIC